MSNQSKIDQKSEIQNSENLSNIEKSDQFSDNLSDKPTKTNSPKDEITLTSTNKESHKQITNQESQKSLPTASTAYTNMTKDTDQRTIPAHPEPSSANSTGGAYIDFGQLHAPDDITDVKSDYSPVGISKARSEDERLAINKSKSGKSYGSRSEAQSSFMPPTIRMDEPSPEGTKPVQTTCKYCYKMVKTKVTFKANEKTWTVCLLLFILLLWPFIWIPFVCKSCKEATHTCPNCGSILSCPRVSGPQRYY